MKVKHIATRTTLSGTINMARQSTHFFQNLTLNPRFASAFSIDPAYIFS